MAGIDKTYLTWEDYLILKNWCEKTELIYDNGIKGSPKDFLYSYNEPYEGEAPVWNTPEPFDRWLYHNCPLSFIQERLREQYDVIYFDNPIEKEETGIHYIVISKPRNNWRYNKYWSIDIVGFTPKGDYLMYGSNSKKWIGHMDLYPSETQSSVAHIKNITRRKLGRLIKKWKLPIGTILEISNRYIGTEYRIKIKK